MTYRLGRRVIDYFESQTNVPVYDPHKQIGVSSQLPHGSNPAKPKTADGEKRPMNRHEIISWYTKLLDGVKTRYRKVERFARYVNGMCSVVV